MQNGVDRQVYSYLQMICSQMITKLENLVTFYDGFLREDGTDLTKTIRELETLPFERARSKMQSQLINIAICGAFSSGKSFLTSAMINRVEWYERDAEIGRAHV